MQRQRAWLSWAIPILMATGIPTLQPVVARAQEARSDLSGRWILNEEQSEDPREKMQARRAGGLPGSSGGPEWMPGPHGAERGGMTRSGGVGGRQDMEGIREAIVRVPKTPTELRLMVYNTQVRIESGQGESLVLPTNGNEVETTVSDRTVEIEAEWDDGKLKVERRNEGGVRVTETYSRAAGSQQMIVAVRVEGPRMETTFKRVYDLANE